MVQAALLALCVSKLRKFETFFISSAALTFVLSLCLLPLSSLEHTRSLRPSILLNAYLLLTILFDIAQTRTLWLASDNYDELSFARLFTAGVAIKALLLVLESVQKTRWVTLDAKDHSPEETAGLFGLSTYMWLNQLFFQGYNKILTMDDLFPLDHEMTSERLYSQSAPYLEPSKMRGKKHALARRVTEFLAIPLLLPVAPRIALMGFKFCQPFLIETLLHYLSSEENAKSHGYGLIGATAIIFTGLAVSTAVYWYFQTRAMYMMRSVLASAVYRKTAEAKIAVADDSAALTLMSVDVERIMMGWRTIHEFWANMVEAAIACWLLSRHLGAASVAPMVVVFLCGVYTSVSAKWIGPRQKAWMQKIQRRVGLTSNMIGQMKQLKISGLAAPVEHSIRTMRKDEIDAGNRFRQVLIYGAVCAHLPVCIAPVVTFAITSQTLDIITMYTSLSYILLLCAPLSYLFQAAPSFFASFTCFTRLQSFIESEPRIDFRKSPAHQSAESVTEKKSSDDSGPRFPAIRISKASFGWGTDKPTLKDIDLEIPLSRLTMIVGPVASGKSTLCKALLGESPSSEGSVVMGSGPSRKIGYCDQTPYMSNATIRENIIGFSPFDPKRYSEVIEATLLQPDLSVLPKGDQTKVGSNGITLSGGQRQRVSMARALYLDASVLVFDDILSGLDADTEEQVFRRVFAPEGLLRRRNATVVLSTHSVRHLPSADHIIALGPEGVIVEQGTFEELLANKQYVHSLGIRDTDSSDNSSVDNISESHGTKEEMSLSHPPAPVIDDDSQNPERMLGEWAVYKYYFTRIEWYYLAAFVVFGLSWGFFGSFVTVWLKFWSEDVISPHPKYTNGFYIGLYGLFQVMSLASLGLMCLVCLTSLISASGTRLHDEALHTVIRAPLKFLTSTDTGVVTNLFSQDMTLIDGELPLSLVNLALVVCSCLGMAAVIATASPFLCVTYPFLAAVLYVIQKFYLRTSRQMRLLDLEAKSPL